MLGLEVVHGAGQLHGFGLQRSQHLGSYRHTPVGVGFDQRIFSDPFVPVIQTVDDAKLTVVLEHPVKQARHERAHLVADARAVAAGGGDYPQERVIPFAGTGFDDVVDGARFMRMQFIDAAKVNVQAVER